MHSMKRMSSRMEPSRTTVLPEPIKALAILSDTIVKISAIEQEDLQSYLQLEKAPSLEVIKLEIQLKQ